MLARQRTKTREIFEESLAFGLISEAMEVGETFASLSLYGEFIRGVYRELIWLMSAYW